MRCSTTTGYSIVMQAQEIYLPSDIIHIYIYFFAIYKWHVSTQSEVRASQEP